MTRDCLTCGKPIVRREGEHRTNFVRRKYCNRSCGCVQAHRLRGKKRPIKEIPCSVCKRPILRAAHFVDAKCPKCMKEAQRVSENAYHAGIRERSRRYRVLMAALGWTDFAELMQYLRSVPWAYLDGKQIRDLRRAA